MRFFPLALISLACVWVADPLHGANAAKPLDDDNAAHATTILEQRISKAKLNLWSRGAFALDEFGDDDQERVAQALEDAGIVAPLRLGPVLPSRKGTLLEMQSRRGETTMSSDGDTKPLWELFRGGAATSEEARIEELSRSLGSEFLDAIEKNKREHAQDCKTSCEVFYCASAGAPMIPEIDLHNGTTVTSYSFGGVPPEDFANEFGFPLDLIKVTEGEPLFSKEEAALVITNAEAEGVDKNEYKSGKYQLGGDWLVNLPKTRAWFNQRLESTFFPLIASLFPEIVSSPSVLRAHSVSLLKYNSSHPRTDVHIDNGIFAMTLAMTPNNQYEGGGTFFEHMGVDHVLPMDVGHGTFRPGSVRHGGHRVTRGTRYILGAFLLLEDKVEHVRRLKNRGSEIRKSGDLDMAAQHFEWALAINPKCTTCLKDWAEVLMSQKRYSEAEAKLREALELLENKDSDALFTLGVVLSLLGRDDDSIEAYQQSVRLNAEDAELCYNLGIKLGAKGKVQEEMEMYAKATQVDPTFGGAWLNWGTTLAETGNFDNAETMFLKAMQCGSVFAPKAMLNLGLLYHMKSNELALANRVDEAKMTALKAAEYVDSAKPLLEFLRATEGQDDDIDNYITQIKPLRIQCHKMVGQILAAQGDLSACEAEFRKATESYPSEASAWQMLARALELQGKSDEAIEAVDRAKALLGR